MAGELILIVEDNEKNLELVRDVLEVKGFATLEARTAGGGIDLAVAQRPALILMDIQLPDMDGVAALQRLRANPVTAGIPVVAVTALAMPEDRLRFIVAGFDACLVKPLDIRNLVVYVRELVAGPVRGGI